MRQVAPKAQSTGSIPRNFGGMKRSSRLVRGEAKPLGLIQSPPGPTLVPPSRSVVLGATQGSNISLMLSGCRKPDQRGRQAQSPLWVS